MVNLNNVLVLMQMVKVAQTCNESHLEREVRLFLINNNIEYEPQKKI